MVDKVTFEDVIITQTFYTTTSEKLTLNKYSNKENNRKNRVGTT